MPWRYPPYFPPLMSAPVTRVIVRAPPAQIRLEGLHYGVEVPAAPEGLPNLPKQIWDIAKRVTVGPGKTATLHVLRGIRAVFRPGTATLLLGSPGSGG